MLTGDRIVVLGHRGLVGSAICRELTLCGHEFSVTSGDLRKPAVAENIVAPGAAYVFMAAGKVGGIAGNMRLPFDFIADNLEMQANVVRACIRYGARLVMLGSSCIYPRDTSQPMAETAIMTGPLEPTNEPYAMAKLSGISMAEAARRQCGLGVVTLMPCNLYGPGDKYGPDAHMVPALLARMHAAKVAGDETFTVWGSGEPRRELMHVDDAARACIHFADASGVINVGTAEDHSIADIAREMARVIGYQGRFVFDKSKPDGTPRKLLDISKARAMGWHSTIWLRDGLERTYRETWT